MLPKLTFYVWLLVPVAVLAYHFGPGQADLRRDNAARELAVAEKAEQREDWPGALRAYAAALAQIPEADTPQRHRIRLSHARVRMYTGEIVEAIGNLKALLTEMPTDRSEAALEDDIRATLGAAEYYTAWLMRLEGAPAVEWTPEIENARQHFRLLSENQLAAGAPTAAKHQENLEAAIRLARMDLSELRGMPMPKFCSSCKDVSQKCRSQSESQSKPRGEKPKDARKGGMGQRPPGGS